MTTTGTGEYAKPTAPVGSHRSTRSTTVSTGDVPSLTHSDQFSGRTHKLIRQIASPAAQTGVQTVTEEFTGPAEVPVEATGELNPTRHGFPAYIGADGSLYDLNYLPVSKVPVDPSTVPADAADVYDVSALARAQPKPGTAAQAYSAGFPDPAQFKTYEEFEKALVAWKEKVEAELGMAIPPTVMGRHYSRPKVGGGHVKEAFAEEPSGGGGGGGGGGAGEGGQEKTVEKWLLPLSGDPWEATLLPPEPQPQFYEEFEQYENAMKRWALEISTKTHPMLPHASQLQSIKNLKIQPAKEVFSLASGIGATAGTDATAETLQRLGTAKSGYVNPHVVHGEWQPTPAVLGQVVPWSVAALKAKLTPADEAAAAKTRPKLMKVFDTIEKERELSRKEHGSFNEPAQIDEATATKLPPLDTRIDWAQLAKPVRDPLTHPYAQSVMKSYESFQYGNKLAEIQDRTEAGLMMPTISDGLQKLEAQVIHMLQTQKPFTFEGVLFVLRTPILLDPFVKIMEKAMPGDFSGATFLTTMTSAVTVQHFPLLMQQWDLSRDPVILAKLAWFVGKLMRANGPQYIHALCGQTVGDVVCLYSLSRCIHFMDVTPPDMFPFSPAMFSLVEIAFKRAQTERCIPAAAKKCSELVLAIYTIYYLRILHHKLGDEKLNYMTASSETTLADVLQKTPAFVASLFYSLGHRSVTVSNAVLVALLQLMRMPNQSIQTYLRGNNSNLCEKLKDLCRSRYSHAQFACHQLSRLLVGDISWRACLFAYFMSNTNLIEQLGGPSKDSSAPQALVSFISRGFLEALDSILDMATADNVWWTLGEDTFTRLLTVLTKAVKEKTRVDCGAEALSKVLEKLCVKSAHLKLIGVRDESKTRRAGAATKELSVSAGEISLIMTLVHQLSGSSDARALSVRAHLLGTVRILLRHKGIFDAVKADPTLYQRVLTFCKDGRHLGFNKNAWKLFYEMVEYHAGVLDFLDRSKLLQQFTDILGTTVHGNVVMIHSLHYLAKLFGLFSKEQERAQKGLPIRRDDNRSVEKDVKTFLTIFKDRHLFIKLHMIYKRFAQTYPGAAFLELAKLYYMLSTLPECQRLLREIQKSDDYKAGIQRIVEMYRSSSSPVGFKS